MYSSSNLRTLVALSMCNISSLDSFSSPLITSSDLFRCGIQDSHYTFMFLGCDRLQCSGVFMVESIVDPGLQKLQQYGRDVLCYIAVDVFGFQSYSLVYIAYYWWERSQLSYMERCVL
ncbi:hypothetical protein SFRURICE_005443 [Spodoptera frugiperda]|nr:hypothetical protein SFRURICE_005443 [Spodoptera frugiperda]